MVLSERQKDILNKTVFEYINRAVPVSSSWLDQRYGLNVSPATIRSELSLLAEDGYLEQPHTSSGRVPTDKGYRFFVDEYGILPETTQERQAREIQCSALILAYYQHTLWKEGWERLLQEPEFTRSDLVANFTRFLLDMERNIELVRTTKFPEVYIGRENPFSRIGDFSMIVCECDFWRGHIGFVAMVGPKRMPYRKNIGLIHSFVNTWKKRVRQLAEKK